LPEVRRQHAKKNNSLQLFQLLIFKMSNFSALGCRCTAERNHETEFNFVLTCIYSVLLLQVKIYM